MHAAKKASLYALNPLYHRTLPLPCNPRLQEKAYKQPQVLGKVSKASLDKVQLGWSLTSESGVVEGPKSFPLIVC